MAYEQEKDELRRFIRNTQDDLRELIDLIAAINPDIPDNVRRLLHSAWEQVTIRFEETIGYLNGDPPLPDYLGTLDQQLELHGLTGDQLRLKLAILERERDGFLTALAEFREHSPTERSRKRGWFGGIAGRTLKVVNKILESLKFIPPVGAVKEIKEAVEALLP